MTSFRRHLQRLGNASETPSGASANAGVGKGTALAVQDQAADSVAERRALALLELRQKMSDLLAETALSVSPPSEPASATARARLSPEQREATALSSLAERAPLRETPHGSFHCRQSRLEGGTFWGVQPLTAPNESRFAALSRLSLHGFDAQSFQRCLFLDTETTGLGTGSGVLPFLVGLGWFEGDVFCTEQLLLSSPAQEPALLHYLSERTAEASMLITFNGKSFDWPLLQTRFILNRLKVPRLRHHLDLYHLGRRVHKARIGRCNLKRIETEVLGFERREDIDGAEVVLRFQRFMLNSDADVLDAVIEHNRLDVVSMAALVSLYGDPALTVAALDGLGVARALKQNGDYESALQICSAALERNPEDSLLHLRAELHLARGERSQAVSDLEALRHCPKARFRLAKLYEHHLKRPDLALDIAQLGTSEAEDAALRREARLAVKLARQAERNRAAKR